MSGFDPHPGYSSSLWSGTVRRKTGGVKAGVGETPPSLNAPPSFFRRRPALHDLSAVVLTSHNCAVIVQSLMIWRRRCLVLVPVLSFLAAVLIMSCGGGSSSSSTTQANAKTILALNVCAGTPPLPAPKPTATGSHTPTPTPTPICSPIVSNAMVGTTVGQNTAQFQAQGLFGFKNKIKSQKYLDVTNSSTTLWNPIAPTVTYPGVINYQGNGLFLGVTTGCTYFTASDAGFSQSVVVGVNTDPLTCQAPPPAVVRLPKSSPEP
jgi:hypothetical protein